MESAVARRVGNAEWQCVGGVGMSRVGMAPPPLPTSNLPLWPGCALLLSIATQHMGSLICIVVWTGVLHTSFLAA